MCDPITAAMAGLQAVSSMSAITAQNAAAAENAQNAQIAANGEYASTTAAYVEQNRSLIQGGFDAILEGRANESIAYTSAIQNGVQGSSVKAVLRDARQRKARNSGRTKMELDSLQTQVGASYAHIDATAKGRINSVPTTSFGFGDAASILSPILSSQTE